MKGLWICCFVMLTACQHSTTSDANPRRPAQRYRVQVTTVERGSVTTRLQASGDLQPCEIMQVTSQVCGALERLLFEPGTKVKRGQILGEIEVTRFRLEADQARSAVQKAEASLGEAEAAAARRMAARRINAELVRDEDLDAVQTKVSHAKASLAEANVGLQRAELSLQRAQVRAPRDGVMESRDVQVGHYMNAGTLIGTLVQRNPMRLNFAVPVADASLLEPAMQVEFRVPPQTQTYRATVRHIASVADPTSRQVQVQAVMSSSETPATLRPGMFARVDVAMRSRNDAIVIPAAALWASEDGLLTYVARDGVAHARRITVGQRSDNTVQVESGLEPGERVVVRGAEALFDGAAIDEAEGDGPISAVWPQP